MVVSLLALVHVRACVRAWRHTLMQAALRHVAREATKRSASLITVVKTKTGPVAARSSSPAREQWRLLRCANPIALPQPARLLSSASTSWARVTSITQVISPITPPLHRIPSSHHFSTSPKAPEQQQQQQHHHAAATASAPSSSAAASPKAAKPPAPDDYSSGMNIIKTLWRVMLTKSGEGYFDGVVTRIGVAIALLVAGKVSSPSRLVSERDRSTHERDSWPRLPTFKCRTYSSGWSMRWTFLVARWSWCPWASFSCVRRRDRHRTLIPRTITMLGASDTDHVHGFVAHRWCRQDCSQSLQ